MEIGVWGWGVDFILGVSGLTGKPSIDAERDGESRLRPGIVGRIFSFYRLV